MALLQRENFSPRKPTVCEPLPIKECDSPPNESTDLLAQYISSNMSKKVQDTSASAMPPPLPPSRKSELLQHGNMSTVANDSDLLLSQDEKVFRGRCLAQCLKFLILPLLLSINCFSFVLRFDFCDSRDY